MKPTAIRQLAEVLYAQRLAGEDYHRGQRRDSRRCTRDHAYGATIEAKAFAEVWDRVCAAERDEVDGGESTPRRVSRA